jgi:L-aminopeptidase/D-esterase-like protein
VATVDAVVLSGGSAFGLAAADGVMGRLEAAGRGFPTKAAAVPIVIGLSLYDLAVGDPAVRPGAAQGAAAFDGAQPLGPDSVQGQLGAGTGATTDKWSGHSRAGGLAIATRRAASGLDGVAVTAVLAVNAFGRIDDGTATDDPGPPVPLLGQNTTIGVIVTNAAVDKQRCHLLAQSGHDGLARSLFPAHTLSDGDALVAAATGSVPIDPVDIFQLRVLAQNAVADAVRSLASSDPPPALA